MTKQEIQVEYQKVACQAGDAYFKLDQAANLVKTYQEQLATLRKRKAELEAALADAAKDEANSESAVASSPG